MSDLLRKATANILRVDVETISDETSLESLASSLNRVKLKLALERLGHALPPNFVPRTFAELVNMAGGNGASETRATPRAVPVPVSHVFRRSANPAANVSGIGIDIEELNSLPVAADFWNDEFYKNIFTQSEIAYCILADSPRTHFAGFWCAKEALRKTDAFFSGVEFTAIRVNHEKDGRPVLQGKDDSGEWRELPFLVSISHTATLAAAVVASTAAVPRAASVPAPEGVDPEPYNSAAREKRGSSRGNVALWILALAGVVTSLAALFRTL